KNKTYTINTLATILNVDSNLIKKNFEKNVSVEIIKPHGKNIDLETAKKIIAADLPGVYVASDVVRYYPYGNTLAHVLGIVGVDNQGITGLEFIYDDFLMGTPGSQNIYTDAHGNKYPNLTGNYTSTYLDFDLILTIVIDIVLTLERVLYNAISLYDPSAAFSLILHPTPPQVLAMASRPNFHLKDYQVYYQE